jgi:hypothetical protein
MWTLIPTVLDGETDLLCAVSSPRYWQLLHTVPLEQLDRREIAQQNQYRFFDIGALDAGPLHGML